MIAKHKSQAQLLMELTAISGEYPAENIHRIIPSTSYARKVVTALINNKQLKPVNKGGVRGYRLDVKSKRNLLAENPARFNDYLDGAADTNKQRSAHTRRLRLHAVAEVYTLMHNAGVRIFKDAKPILYPPDVSGLPSQPDSVSPGYEITTPCFYSSREQKGEDANAIRGSRAMGTLLTPTHVYAIYNTGGANSHWRESVEMRYKAEAQDYLCRKLLAGQYNGGPVGGIMLGEDFQVSEKYLIVQSKTESGHSFLTQTYRPFYFITNDDYGESQLRLLCDSTRMTALKTIISKKLKPADAKYPIEHDAFTEDGTPVLFCCLLNIPRLVQFRTGIQLHGKFGKVIAFDFQRELLEKYLGGMVTLTTLSIEKLMELLQPR